MPAKNSASTPPSERQLAYARGVGISVPTDATAAEVSDLLTAHEWKGQPATPELQAIASQWRVPFTRFTCLEDLHDRTTRALIEADRGADLAAWFAFNVAKDIGAPVTAPTDPALSEIAAHLAADEGAMRSMRRKDQGRWLRFGEWAGDDGFTEKGASRETAAYKAAAALIRSGFGIAAPAPRRKGSPQTAAPVEAKAGGCLSTVAGVGLITWLAVVGTIDALQWLAG